MEEDKRAIEELNRGKDTEFNHEAFYEFLLNVINPNEMEKYRSMFLSSGEKVKGEQRYISAENTYGGALRQSAVIKEKKRSNPMKVEIWGRV